jgi:FAD/FMN-containing dehydrogenase
VLSIHQDARVSHEPYFADVERLLREMGGRPHWGKLHSLDATRLRSRYPRFDEVTALRADVDPQGLWRNAYLGRVLGY